MKWFIVNIWENDNLVNWLTAIGTIGAVVVSLWLATKKEKNKHVEIEFLKNDKKSMKDKFLYIGRIKVYNPTKENKTLYDMTIRRGIKGILILTDSKFSIINNIEKENVEKINYVSLNPKEMVIIEYEIVTTRGNYDKVIFEGKEEDGYVIRCSFFLENKK